MLTLNKIQKRLSVTRKLGLDETTQRNNTYLEIQIEIAIGIDPDADFDFDR